MSNVYKPRYKVCYQTKNKVWIYKNSRLRRMYNIRSKVILKKDWKNKYLLASRNMKWTIARRLIIPSTSNRISFFYNYKNALLFKQQLKHFYGKIREEELKKIFFRTWKKELFNRRSLFLSSLEQRLDIVLYRMRLLPTVYACHQLINHQGVYINNTLVNIPGYRLKIGEILSITKKVWPIIYDLIHYKLQKRFFGQKTAYSRQNELLSVLQKILIPKIDNYDFNRLVIKKYSKNKSIYLKLIRFVQNKLKFYNEILDKNKKLTDSYQKKDYKFYKILNFILISRIYKEFKQIEKNIKHFFHWSNDKFFSTFNLIMKKNLYISKMYLLIQFNLQRHNQLNIFNSQVEVILNDKNISDKLKNKLLLTLNLKKLKTIDKIYSKFKLKYFILKKSNDLFIQRFYKIYLKLNYVPISYRKVFLNRKALRIIRTLKYRKLRKKRFNTKCFKHHWYTPKYLEVDYKTLRGAFLYHPNVDEIVYAFPCTLDKLITFYKEQAF